jgi:hypothetical protein
MGLYKLLNNSLFKPVIKYLIGLQYTQTRFLPSIKI